MKILNISMIALALATAGTSAAFARGGLHTESPMASGNAGGAVDAYVVPSSSNGVIVTGRSYGLDQESAATLRVENQKDFAQGKR